VTVVPSDARLPLPDGNQVGQLTDPDAIRAAVREASLFHCGRLARVLPLVREPLSTGIFGIKSGDVQSQDLLGFKAAGFRPSNR
jgi:ornithine cyclodeaminase